MNRTFATLILTASVFATLGVSSLNAQERGIADVPFAFHVQNQVMPAGKYEVKQFENSNPALFTIADWKGHSRFLTATPDVTANPEKSKLTFACYQGDCTLVKMELPGSSISRSVTPGKSTYKVGMASLVKIAVTH